jgi:hypothetical protein
MIVKVQRPLFTTEKIPKVLIYNRARTIEWFEPYTDYWKGWFGKHLKRYAKAHIEKTILIIDEVVADQDW